MEILAAQSSHDRALDLWIDLWIEDGRPTTHRHVGDSNAPRRLRTQYYCCRRTRTSQCGPSCGLNSPRIETTRQQEHLRVRRLHTALSLTYLARTLRALPKRQTLESRTSPNGLESARGHGERERGCTRCKNCRVCRHFSRKLRAEVVM